MLRTGDLVLYTFVIWCQNEIEEWWVETGA
jgi:hypothetical protein